MGIDIHFHAERKQGGTWEHVPHIEFSERDYSLFQLLRGEPEERLRRTTVSLKTHAGLPVDASMQVREQAAWIEPGNEYVFGHHFAILRELMEFDWQKFAKSYSQDEYPGAIHPFVAETIPQLEALGSPDEVRIVYWFER